jgi:hypothetical protein
MKPASKFDRQMAAEINIEVMLAVNDDNGNFSGHVAKIEIGDAMDLEAPGFCVEDGPPIEYLPGPFPSRKIVLCGRRFPVKGYRSWVGNIIWDKVEMSGTAVVILLNLLKREGWNCVDAETRMFNLFESETVDFELSDSRILAKRDGPTAEEDFQALFG